MLTTASPTLRVVDLIITHHEERRIRSARRESSAHTSSRTRTEPPFAHAALPVSHRLAQAIPSGSQRPKYRSTPCHPRLPFLLLDTQLLQTAETERGCRSGLRSQCCYEGGDRGFFLLLVLRLHSGCRCSSVGSQEKYGVDPRESCCGDLATTGARRRS